MGAALRHGLVVGVVLLSCACGTVPDITFEEPAEAGPTDGPPLQEAASDSATKDSAVGDGSTGCVPGVSPPEAEVCCESAHPCSGTCNATNCARCITECPPMRVCCAKGNRVNCLDPGQRCN